MSNDELYYDELTNLAERIASGFQNRTKPLDQLNQALNQLASTNSIKGKAADSMKAYIGEVHLTLIQTLSLALTNYQMVLGKYVNSYLEVDGNHNFKLVREDLEEHQSQLGDHRSDFTDLAAQLKAISDKAEGIVYLGGAGSSYLKNVAQKMDDMKKIANELMDKWNAYEQSEPGFNQIQDLLAQTRSLLKSTLKVPRGYDYKAGSFSGLMSKDFINALQTNASYAMDSKNQKEFSDDWTSINKDYTKDQERLAEAAAKKKAKEEGLWGLVTDVLQTVAGAAITAVGLGLTPFTGGLSLGLVALGGTMVVGGINSAINHASMATTGKGYNLIGNIANGVGECYNKTLGKSLGQTGVGGFVNGFLSGAGETVSGMAQFNIVDTTKGVYTLVTDSQARSQFSSAVGNWWHQLSSGNTYTMGETTAVVASMFVGGEGATTGKLDRATSLLSKGKTVIRDFKTATSAGTKAFGKSLLGDTSKFGSTSFESFTAIEKGAKSLGKATVTGVKEGKSALRTVKAQEKGLVRLSEDGRIDDLPNIKYNTKIDSKVVEIPKNTNLPDFVQKSFTDGQYRTVATSEDVKLYRVFGGGSDAGGGFATTSPATSRIQTKIDSALLPEWKGTRMYEAEIEIPKGTELNIGKVAPQTIKESGTVLMGGADQILLPKDWPLDWIKHISLVPSK